MSVASRSTSQDRLPTVHRAWSVAWEWLARPIHSRAVRELWLAAESGDEHRLSEILDPKVAVVVESQDVRASGARVTYGVTDATTLLVHGMGKRAGLKITPRSVNSQAGLLLTRDGEAAALITVDFNGPLVSVVWIRLHPEILRHGNRV